MCVSVVLAVGYRERRPSRDERSGGDAGEDQSLRHSGPLRVRDQLSDMIVESGLARTRLAPIETATLRLACLL
jgi:hypothetical protein